jgi:apolipoprotein N-acyltransferase
MRVADIRMYATWALLALYCSLFLPMAILLVRYLDRRLPLPLVVTFPVVWTALEFFRSHFATGFSWYLLAHTQHDFLPVIQAADLGGVYTVSILVAAVNALLFEFLLTRQSFRLVFALGENVPQSPRKALVLSAAWVVLLAGGTLGYGYWQLANEDFAPGPRLALVQGNVPQSTRNDAWKESENAQEAADDLWDHYRLLSTLAAAAHPDLLVWPETSCPFAWVECLNGHEDSPIPRKDSLELAADMAKWWNSNILVGLNTHYTVEDQTKHRFNSALLIGANGRPVARYDKIHLVPYGEYVPFRSWLPFMNSLSPYDYDYSMTPGDQYTRFPLGDKFFGVVICYEDTDPALARKFVQPDGQYPVDFLVNITNDGWFNGTSEHEEHLAVSRFRAVETRRSLARAVNMGISAVIDSSGRVLAPQLVQKLDHRSLWKLPPGISAALPTQRWAEFKKTELVLLASIPIDQRKSLYARWGDWLPWSCWLLLGGDLTAAFFRRV